MANKTESRAREIIGIHLDEIEKELKNEILAVILVGSLTNNSYTGNAGSDIDLIHVLKNEAAADCRNRLRELIEKTEMLTSFDLPLAKNIYRLNEMKRPFRNDFELCLANKDLIELPIEILRIKDSGITIWGEDIIASIDTPKREDIISSRKLSRKWGEQEKERNPDLHREKRKHIEKPTVRIIVQSIIVYAMLDYYFITDRSCSSKKEIGERMRQEVEKYIFQDILDLCITYRYKPE